MIIITLLIGFIIWYIYYSIECGINGGTIMHNPYLMAFYFFLEECLWLLPNGKRKFFKDRNMEYEPELLPGKLHFLLTHILLPLSPTILFLLDN